MSEQRELTPTQQRVLDELIAPQQSRPSFPEKLAHELRRALDDSLSDLDDAITKDQIMISKSMLAQVHTCEGHFLAEDGNFSWSAPAATGVVAHKGVELSFSNRQTRTPVELVDLAIERMKQDGGRGTPGQWLDEADEAELADLRGAAIDRVGKFLDTFPPLTNQMRPRFESSLVAEIMDKAIQLRGKVDLAMFKATGNTSGVLIVELKTGKTSSHHLEDLRFYALLETLRSGVPPYRVATLYLDSGTFSAEDVTEEMLYSAVKRTSVGIHKIIETRNGTRPVELTPGPMCNYCSAQPTCERGNDYQPPSDWD